MKRDKSMIIFLSSVVIVAAICFAWQYMLGRDIYVESKDGKWKVGYVKAEESFDPQHRYHCVLTYHGGDPEKIEQLSFEYFYEGTHTPASYGDYTKKEIRLPMTFGDYGDRLKWGEKRIVKLKWQENGKNYQQDLLIKRGMLFMG